MYQMNLTSCNRRTFLSALAISGAAIGVSRRSFGAPLSPRDAWDKEAARLTHACYGQFWDDKARMFRAPVLSAETVPSDALHDRGYTLWASLLGLHALVEGEKAHSGRYTRQIATVYQGLKQYYSEEMGAYTAWLQFPGNVDAYYDDNAWVVIILVEASGMRAHRRGAGQTFIRPRSECNGALCRGRL